MVATVNAALADGEDPGEITVTLLDEDLVPLAGHEVIIDVVSASLDPDAVTFTPPVEISDGSGVVVFDVYSTLEQAVTLSAVDITDLVAITATDAITYSENLADAGTSTAVAADGIAIADGIDTELITVTVLNSVGTPLVGNEIELTPDNPSGITITPHYAGAEFTNGDGVARFTTTSSEVRNVTFTATDITDPGTPIDLDTVAVDYQTNAFDDALSTVVADAGTMEVGLDDHITVTLLNNLGNPVPNISVALAVDSATVDAAAVTVPAAADDTGTNGQVTFAVTSSVAQSVVFSATAGGTPLSDTALITYVLGTNLVAEAIGVEVLGGVTTASITYTVEGLATVNPFEIQLRIDPDGAGPAAESTVNLGVGDGLVFDPGTYTIASDITAHLTGTIENGATVLAEVDIANAVAESDETPADNQQQTTLEVNLQAGSVGVASVGGAAITTVTYTVISPAEVPGFEIQLRIDPDGAGPVTESTINLAAADGLLFTPGTHTITQDISAELNDAIVTGATVLAEIDINNDVVESDETPADNQKQTVLEVNLQAGSVGVASVGGATIATVTYTISSPATVPQFEIQLRIDPDGAGPAAMTTVNLAVGDGLVFTPGTHTITSDITAHLTGMIQNGAIVLAEVDINDDVAETNETPADNVRQTALEVNLQAGSISVARVGAATIATVTYTVNSPAEVPPFTIQLRIDPDGAGPLPVSNVDLAAAGVLATPGTHTVPGDITADLNGQIENGATVEAEVDANDDVLETIETALDDQVDTILEVDIASGLVAIDIVSNTVTNGEATYTINSPATLPPFTIHFGLDVDANGTIDNPLLDIAAPDLTPGTHTATADIRAALDAVRVEHAYEIITVVDSVLDITESNETNNNGAKAMSVDLSANSLILDGALQATLTYTVNSPALTALYDLSFYIDDGDGLFDPVLDGPAVGTVQGESAPGTHTEVFDYSTNDPAGNLIFAWVDSGETVLEGSEINNDVSPVSTTADLVANAVSVTSDLATTTASISYTVNFAVSVGAFDIAIGRDTNADDVIDDLLDTINVNTPALLTPGFHQADSADFRAALNALAPRIGNDDRIIAVIDSADTIVESVGNNNTAGEFQEVDLAANAITVSSDDVQTSATIAYTITSPANVDAFVLRIGRDLDSDGAIDAGAELAEIDIATLGTPDDYLTPGAHQLDTLAEVPDFRAALDALVPQINNDETLIVVLDTANSVAESSETVASNVAGETQRVDLVLASIAVEVAGPATTAKVTYQIESPARVPDFTVQLGIDDNDNGLLDAGEELGGPVAAVAMNPGTHTLDIPVRALLDGVVRNADNLVAVVDFGATVGEAVEDINNVGISTDLEVDLRIDDLLLNDDPFQATLTYSVISPARVAPYTIRFSLTVAGNILVPDQPGQQEPGTYSVTIDLADGLLAQAQTAGATATIIAELDPADTVMESNPAANNQMNNDADYRVDLQMVFMNFAGTDVDVDFDITAQYRVAFNQPVENFTVAVFASPNAEPVINLATDVLLRRINVTNANDKRVGILHNLDIDNLQVSSADFPRGDFFLKIWINEGNTLAEASNENNILSPGK